MKKTILSIAVLSMTIFGAVTTGNAQHFGAGAGLSFLKFGNSDLDTKMHLAPGLRGRWDNDDKLAVSFGFHFYLPNSYDASTSLSPLSSADPYLTVTYTDKFSALHIFVHGNYYLVGESGGDELGLYGIFGAGYMSETAKSAISTTVDPSKYSTAAYEGSFSGSGLTIDLGAGVDIPVSSFKVFGEAQLNLPANSANGETIEVKINSSYCFNLGVRFPFGN
jgi:hypothetical protein